MIIQRKADKLIQQSGIIEILQKFGKAFIVGSYNMRIMTWNDLDIYFYNDNFSHTDYCNMTAELIKVLLPVRFDGIFKIEKNQVFLGFETEITKERWNIDIWRKSKAEIDASIVYAQDLVRQMERNPLLKESVIRIKQDLIQRKLYGFDKGRIHYHSKEIYNAVFEENILTTEQFLSSYKAIDK